MTYDKYIYTYIYTDKIAKLHVSVGLAQARPNYTSVIPYSQFVSI